MKRHRENVANQAAVKKPDIPVSSDLRSKIGAKLQTLLNGVPQTRLFHRSRRQLYADLFETRHSPIIIDPTIVIKTEPEDEECSSDTTSFNSQNFLLSAKTRLTELLNKTQDATNKYPFKDNGSENTLSNNKHVPTSSMKSNCSSTTNKSQSLSSSSASKKRKASFSRDNSTESAILKNAVVILEDIMHSNCSSNLKSSLTNAQSMNKQSKSEAVKCNVTNEARELFVASDTVECVIEEGSSSIEHPIANENNPELYTSNSLDNAVSPEPVLLDNSDVVHNDITVGTAYQFPYNNDDSELVDDPSAYQAVINRNDLISSDSNHFSNAGAEPDVEFLFVKKPTYEVITLEDNEKENTLSSNKHTPTSSMRSNCSSTTTYKSQPLSSSSASKKRKASCSKDDSTESAISQVKNFKNAVVILEDIMHSNCSSNLESSLSNAQSMNEQSKSEAAKCNMTNEARELFVASDTVECVIEEGSSSIEHPVANENNPELYTSKSLDNAVSPEPVLLDNCGVVHNDITVGTAYQFPFNNVDDSELVDDPSAYQAVINRNDLISSDSNHFSNAGAEPEVEFLFVKKPTHEVITLEDNDDSDDVIEEVHRCPQCGKAFRARSLLNFHVRMHGNDSSVLSSSVYQHCS